MKTLREVKITERLPSKEGTYIVITDDETVNKYGYIDSLKDYWLNNVQCWYEPIEYESEAKKRYDDALEYFYSTDCNSPFEERIHDNLEETINIAVYGK